MAGCFNPEPIMLCSPTSNNNQKYEQEEKDVELLDIPQRLAPELFQYEFPPKSRIMAIEEIAKDQENDEFSFFDECSFTTISTLTNPDDYSNIVYEEQEDNTCYYINRHNDSEDRLDRYFESFVADHQLSPLQLPSQTNANKHVREESCDSTGTIKYNQKTAVRPSSFLNAYDGNQHEHHYLTAVNEKDRINWDEKSFTFPDYSSTSTEKVHTSVHPYHCRLDEEDEDEELLLEDDVSSLSSTSIVIVMKINKKNPMNPPTVIQKVNHDGSYISADEGYDDELDDCNELPIESASVFLPLSDQEQEQLACLDLCRQKAAIKIQSFWRGYCERKNQKIDPKTKLTHRVLAGLVRVNDSIQSRNNNQLLDRIYSLEDRLSEETAMRIAFEKAMEDMTVLMDHQHKILHDRVEGEVGMRQFYEQKVESMMKQVQPLESRLRHESKARTDMESMMSRVLDQLHDVKLQQKQQADEKRAIQKQLNEALQEIESLKKNSTGTVTRSKTPSSFRPVSKLSRASSPVKRATPSTSAKTTTHVSRATTPIKRATTPSNAATVPKTSARAFTPDNYTIRRTTTTTLKKTATNRKL